MLDSKYRSIVIKDASDANRDVTVSIHDIAKAINVQQLAAILEDTLNGYNMGKGTDVGKYLTNAHPTLQGVAINFFLDALMAMGNQSYTDRRNETGVRTCRKIRELLNDGRIERNPFI